MPSFYYPANDHRWVELPAGVVVMLCMGAVHRDGSDAMSTDELVIGVRAHRHWSLGAGSMRCRGGHIVRQVLRVLVEEWVGRAGHVGLVPGFRPVAGFPRDSELFVAAGAAASDEGLVLVHNLDECSHSIQRERRRPDRCEPDGGKTGPSLVRL